MLRTRFYIKYNNGTYFEEQILYRESEIQDLVDNLVIGGCKGIRILKEIQEDVTKQFNFGEIKNR